MSGAIPFSEASRTGYQRKVGEQVNPVLQGYVWPRYDAAPGQGEKSLSYFDMTKGKPGWYNGSAWKYALEEDASGNVTVTGTLAAGNTTITGTLSVSGTSTLGVVNSGNHAITGTLNVSGATTLAGVSAGAVSASSVSSSGALTASTGTFSGKLGYASGQGGTVTQITSKSTGVTLNRLSGQVTMSNANLAAGTIASFTMSNNTVGSEDNVILNHISGGTLGAYGLNARTGSNSMTIDVRNNTAGDLAEAIVLRFTVIKSVNS